MNKEKLKACMVEMEKKDVKENVIRYHNYLQDQDIDEDATRDSEDLSYRNASDEISDGIDHQIHSNKNVMVNVAEVDFSDTEIIRPGAVFSIGDKNMVVAGPTQPFDFDGARYIGISVNSPIYPQVEGLKSGDQFEYQGKKYTISMVQ